jgi:uncharacterized repeat protein (TIGR01451 family)
MPIRTLGVVVVVSLCLLFVPSGDLGAIIASPGALSFSSATYSGSEGSFVTITVTRTGGSDGPASIDYQTGNGSAVEPSDYTPASGTLQWADGESAPKTFDITLPSDAVYDGMDSFGIALANAQGASFGAIVQATVSIVDAQGPPSIAFPDASSLEGDSAGTPITFTLTLSGPAEDAIVMNYSTSPDSAQAFVDYQPETGSFVIPAGELTHDLVLIIVGDTVPEPDETYVVHLLPPPGFTGETAIATILNDDGPVADLSVTKDVVTPGPYFTGGEVTYEITVSNAGPQSATNVVVTDELPDGLELVSASPSCSGTTTITCNVGTLASAASTTVTLVARIVQPGTIVNTATADSDETDPTAASGSESITANASTTAAVPTASAWMLLALALALAFTGYVGVR